VTTIAIALAFVLCALAALHARWAVRNRFESTFVIPKVDGQYVFIPSQFATSMVALALFAAAVIALAQGQVIALEVPPLFVLIAAYGAGAVFMLRAIGDFRLVGFFKRIRNTTFARWDTRLFSPLSALMGTGFLYLAYLASR